MKSIKSYIASETVLQWLVVVSIFQMRIETLAMLLVLWTTKWQGLPIFQRIAIVLLLHASLISLIWGYSMVKPIQQVVLVGIHFVGYYTFFTSKVVSINDVWQKYLKFCEIIGYVGVFQGGMMLVLQINPFSFVNALPHEVQADGIIRLHAFFGEPGYLASFLIPYIIYSITNYSDIDKKKFFITFFVFIATFAAAAFAVIFVYVIYRLINSKYKVFSYVCAVLLVTYVSMEISGVSEDNDKSGISEPLVKIEESFKAFSDMDPYLFESLNASTYATMTNLWVAINAPSRILGTGIGTHEQSYTQLYPPSTYKNYGLNMQDAYSLFTRVFSEFGVVGLMVLFFLLYKGFNKSNIINVSCFFYILSLLIRGGHYTINGVFFFALIYYFTSKRYKEDEQYAVS